MSDKVIKIGMLRIELHLAFDGVGAAIWEDDDLLRPTKRTLRLSLNGKEMKTLVDGVNSFYANKQPVGPTPHPVATLCEAVEAYFVASDKSDEFVLGTKMYYHGTKEREAMRRALSAERKRAARISKIVSESKANGHSSTITPENDICHICQWLAALDAFDNGAENG